ncbi:hypothetical protein [Sorangium sp. So ce426]|uniref:hypothetical protein n=1 Tax=Sorangium sp. So ce426 TaxID=3133312 RepID=UPI003F5C7333
MTDSEARLRRRLKHLGVGLAATAALLVLFRAGASAWGQSRLRDYVDATEAEWDAERAQIRERARAAREGSAGEDCGASYARIPMIPLSPLSQMVEQAMEAGPSAPLSPELLAVLERQRPALDAFRQAARCSHVELAKDEPLGDLAPVWPALSASRLVLIEGHALAARGDARGALDRYLTVAKVSADMSAGSHTAVVSSAFAATPAYRGIAALVAGAPRLAPAELAELDRALAERGRHLPLLSDAIRKERLDLRKTAVGLSEGGTSAEEIPFRVTSASALSLTLVLPADAVFGEGIPQLDARLRRAEQIALDAQRDPSQIGRFRELANDSLAADATPFGSFRDPEFLQDLARRDCALRASYLLARAAVEAERAYTDGGYPEALPALAQDPCGTGPLVYRKSPDGGGYSLFSVGKDGKAGGPRAENGRISEGDDLVVTRRGEGNR